MANSTQFGSDSNYSKFNGENCFLVTVLALDERNTLATTFSRKCFPSDHQESIYLGYILLKQPVEHNFISTTVVFYPKH